MTNLPARNVRTTYGYHVQSDFVACMDLGKAESVVFAICVCLTGTGTAAEIAFLNKATGIVFW